MVFDESGEEGELDLNSLISALGSDEDVVEVGRSGGAFGGCDSSNGDLEG